jgi:hypothetical protein
MLNYDQHNIKVKLLFLQENNPAVSIDGYEKVPENDEDALLKAAANQPVSVAIDAGGSDFQFYSEVNFRKLLKYFVNLASIREFPHCKDDE